MGSSLTWSSHFAVALIVGSITPSTERHHQSSSCHGSSPDTSFGRARNAALTLAIPVPVGS
jgi:hypothetical protein